MSAENTFTPPGKRPDGTADVLRLFGSAVLVLVFLFAAGPVLGPGITIPIVFLCAAVQVIWVIRKMQAKSAFRPIHDLVERYVNGDLSLEGLERETERVLIREDAPE